MQISRIGWRHLIHTRCNGYTMTHPDGMNSGMFSIPDLIVTMAWLSHWSLVCEREVHHMKVRLSLGQERLCIVHPISSIEIILRIMDLMWRTLERYSVHPWPPQLYSEVIVIILKSSDNLKKSFTPTWCAKVLDYAFCTACNVQCTAYNVCKEEESPNWPTKLWAQCSTYHDWSCKVKGK